MPALLLRLLRLGLRAVAAARWELLVHQRLRGINTRTGSEAVLGFSLAEWFKVRV